MPQVFLTQTHRDEFNAAHVFYEEYRKANDTVRACHDKPRLVEYARDRRTTAGVMFAAFINAGLCRDAEPGEEITAIDSGDVYDLHAAATVWRRLYPMEHNPRRRAGSGYEPVTLELLYALLPAVLAKRGSSVYRVPKFRSEIVARMPDIDRVTPELVEVERQRINL